MSGEPTEPTLGEKAGLSAAHTAKGRLQRALLERLRVHERDDMLPTSHRWCGSSAAAQDVPQSSEK